MTVRFLERLKPLLVPLDSIRQHPENPNNGDLEKLIESIETNGFTTVLTVDAETGYILAGNHRYQALHALGATEAPVVFADYDRLGGIRYMIADNATGQAAVLEKGMLNAHLKELQASEYGLLGSGHTDEEFERSLLKMAADDSKVLGHGFNNGIAPNGIYQVVITFDNENDRDEALATLADDYERIKAVSM